MSGSSDPTGPHHHLTFKEQRLQIHARGIQGVLWLCTGSYMRVNSAPAGQDHQGIRDKEENGLWIQLNSLNSRWSFPVRLWLMRSGWWCLFPCVCSELFNWSQSCGSWCSTPGQQNKHPVVHLVWSGGALPQRDWRGAASRAADCRKTLSLQDLLWNTFIPEMDFKKGREKNKIK